MQKNNEKALFEVKNLTVEYHSGDAIIHAVSGVSFDLKPGETLGLARPCAYCRNTRWSAWTARSCTTAKTC